MIATAVNGYERAIKGVTLVFNSLSMVLLAVMMFLGAADVIGRYLFNRPIIGTMEMSEIFMATMTMLGISGVQLLKSHVTVDLFTRNMSPRLKASTHLATTILALGVFVIIAWRSIIISNIYANAGRLVFTVLWPMAPLQLIVTVGASILCLVFILDIFRYAQQIKGGA